MSQQDLMEKDTVLVLDLEDNVIGSESKRASHEFNLKQPTGVLHRAFSVFIFDESTNELLLQQRAKEKITFPSVRYYRLLKLQGTIHSVLRCQSFLIGCNLKPDFMFTDNYPFFSCSIFRYGPILAAPIRFTECLPTK